VIAVADYWLWCGRLGLGVLALLALAFVGVFLAGFEGDEDATAIGFFLVVFVFAAAGAITL
jgi:hypothetical protein